MKRNKIEGVKPFNLFFFRSCYYQQLISAVSCFGVDKENILSNDFLFISDNFNCEEKEIISDKALLKSVGCSLNKCIINKRKLCNNINLGNPVIVGVDSYYLKSRFDTYLQRHEPHYVLVLGYDLDKDYAYVIDHNYANDFLYQEKNISLDNLLTAAKMFEKDFFKRHKANRIVKNTNSKLNNKVISLWQRLPLEVILKNHAASKSNLIALRKIFECGNQVFERQSLIIERYLKHLNAFCMLLASFNLFQEANKALLVNRLLSDYRALLSFVRKAIAGKVYAISENHCEKLICKIDEIIDLEKQLYAILAENCHE